MPKLKDKLFKSDEVVCLMTDGQGTSWWSKMTIAQAAAFVEHGIYVREIWKPCDDFFMKEQQLPLSILDEELKKRRKQK